MNIKEIFDKVSLNKMAFIGVAIILGLVWFDLATIQEQKISVVRECNQHWRQRVMQVCPALNDSNIPVWIAIPDYNVSGG